jgi:hypothetical protein
MLGADDAGTACRLTSRAVPCLLADALIATAVGVLRTFPGAFDFSANVISRQACKAIIDRPAFGAFVDRRLSTLPRPISRRGAATMRKCIMTLISRRWIDGSSDSTLMSFRLPPNSPELNSSEIARKHAIDYWRRFITLVRETVGVELGTLLDGSGSKFEIRFSLTLTNVTHIDSTGI